MGMESECYKKILIVDDEAANLQIIVESIEGMGQQYAILLANNAVKAITIIKDELPDIIITDWEMPGLDGVDLIKMVKGDETIAHIPILMCTGVMVSAEHLKVALEAGAIDYIRKPFDKIELNARLNSMMKLAESTQKIRDLNEKKERLLSIIAHDLRGPLGGIKYLASITINEQNETNNQNALEALAQIEEQASATYNLLNNLLLWIKLPDSTAFYHPQIHQVEAVITDCTSICMTVINEKKVTLSLVVDNTTAFFDRELISSVIRNLLSNAIKCSQQGGNIVISSYVQDDVLVVKISDSGIGMSPEQVRRITAPPTGINESNASRTKGWGIGLKLASQILSLHQSYLRVESQLGKGSTIWFTLPISSKAEQTPATLPNE
jgi:two-component system sensor histidine kinase/response regulator